MVAGLLEYRLQPLNPLAMLLPSAPQEAEREVLLYSTAEGGLAFLGSLTNDLLQKWLSQSSIHALSQQATRISSFELIQGGRSALRICVVTLLFYRIYLDLETGLAHGRRVVLRPLHGTVRGIREPFQISRLRGSATGSRLSQDYSLTSFVESTCASFDDLYIQARNKQLETCSVIRLSPGEGCTEV